MQWCLLETSLFSVIFLILWCLLEDSLLDVAYLAIVECTTTLFRRVIVSLLNIGLFLSVIAII